MLDAPDIPGDHLELNLRELHRINRWLGGYTTSLTAIRRVLSPKQNAVVVDIGCGGGETARLLHEWGRKNRYNLQVKAIDINPHCITYATRHSGGLPGLQFICDDYRNLAGHVPEADVLHASLFCHHLSDVEIVELLRFACENRLTLVINDLVRHPVAYYGIKLLTRILSRSNMVKNDAPLSVLRGFKREEWRSYLHQAGISSYSIRSKPLFRHEIIVRP